MRYSKTISAAALLLSVLAAGVSSSYAQFGLGADVVSRYVWRGTDFGNSAAVQPGIAYTAGAVEIGAWASWSVDGSPSGNENDLYVTYNAGPVGITVTDYFFPSLGFTDDNFLDYGNDVGAHSLEAMISYGGEGFSLLGGYFFTGGDGIKKSVYLEGSYDLPLPTDEIGASIVVGAGNEQYTTDTDFNLVVIGLSLSKESWFASYMINPEKETTFLVFGKSF